MSRRSQASNGDSSRKRKGTKEDSSRKKPKPIVLNWPSDFEAKSCYGIHLPVDDDMFANFDEDPWIEKAEEFSKENIDVAIKRYGSFITNVDGVTPKSFVEDTVNALELPEETSRSSTVALIKFGLTVIAARVNALTPVRMFVNDYYMDRVESYADIWLGLLQAYLAKLKEIDSDSYRCWIVEMRKPSMIPDWVEVFDI